MNKQGNKTNPSGGIEWTHIFGPGTGYTANPVRGCQHQCRWRMQRHRALGEPRTVVLGLLSKEKEFGRPDILPLSDYADEATFNFLLPNAGWTFDQWKAVNREVARMLEARGYRVAFGRIELNEYFDFLAKEKRDNTPQTRALYAGLKACPPGTELK